MSDTSVSFLGLLSFFLFLYFHVPCSFLIPFPLFLFFFIFYDAVRWASCQLDIGFWQVSVVVVPKFAILSTADTIFLIIFYLLSFGGNMFRILDGR